MTSRAQITLTPGRDGMWHYRVHLCLHEDHSGWALSLAAAFRASQRLMQTVCCYHECFVSQTFADR